LQPLRTPRYWRSSQGLHLHALEVNDLGLALAVDGDSADAIWLCQRALANACVRPQALTNLGAILLASGRLNEAVPQLEKAIRLDPKFAQAHAVLGRHSVPWEDSKNRANISMLR
jgi:Flp pilus assembly protein TadD